MTPACKAGSHPCPCLADDEAMTCIFHSAKVFCVAMYSHQEKGLRGILEAWCVAQGKTWQVRKGSQETLRSAFC